MPHTVVLPLNYIHLFKLILIQDLNVEILGFEPKITICKIAVLPIKLYPLFKLILIQDSNSDPNIMLYHWANNNILLTLIYLIDNYINIKHALKMTRTSIQILTVFCSTFEL
jgi:hypothetical protein